MRRLGTFAALPLALASLYPCLAWAQEAPAEGAHEELEPARPAPAGKGVVWGVVTDAAKKEPLMDAAVTVVNGKQKAAADLDGRYRLELPPGTYELRVWFEGHKARRLQRVVVVAGKVTKLDVSLEGDKVVEEVVEVEVTPERASPEAQLVLRKNAAQVGDALSAKEIAKTPDRNAADAARRVVGATLVGGKYVYVRGLGERYTNALLNGTPLPSAEPDRQSVPLDLFPSLVLSDITIVKSFTPDMPGDFAGGSVRINTRELPEALLWQVNLNLGFNTQTTFAERLGYQGSRTDWLGLDSGARALPADVPIYKLVRLGPKLGGGMITPGDLTRYGREINTYMSTRRTLDLPNGSGNAVVGNTFELGGGQEIGVIGAITYGRRFLRRQGEIVRTYTVEDEAKGTLKLRNDYLAETGLDQVTWGAYASAAYKPSKDHKIAVMGLHTRNADNEARTVEGHNDERSTDIRDTRLRFLTRSLTYGQISGTHKLGALGDALVDWNLLLSYATADEPDTRETVYAKDFSPDGKATYSWVDGPQSGSHFFGKQRERGYGGGLSFTQPILKGDLFAKLKFGALVNSRARSFDARRFRFTGNRAYHGPDVGTLPPDELFNVKNIGAALELQEFTKPNDAYDAGLDVYSGYLMTDAWLSRRARVILGARVEAARQVIESRDPYTPGSAEKTENDTTDLLPSATVVFKATPDANLRLSASRTVARPQFRELSRFLFTNQDGLDELGNPNLERTSIYNADLRFEWFPGKGEVIAVSAFYKQFYAPIETIITPTNQGTVTYDNADSARVLGMEIEVRKSLGFIAAPIKDLALLANLTLVTSRVQLTDEQVGVLTSAQRPLAGQSPYVINAGLDYANEATGTRARVLYNVFGPRIARVGAFELPDVYEEPRHLLDATVAQRVGKWVDLRLAAENILDAPVRFTQGAGAGGVANIVNRYRNGATITLGVTVSNM